MKFGENLMLIRKRKGYSQEDLALAIDVSRQTIYSWESELNYPNVMMLKKIADVLGVTSDDLINGYDVSRLPNTLGKINVSYIKKHDGEIFYDELPNWFVKLEVGEEVCFALYDSGRRDYSYHICIASKVLLHNESGLEATVEEYDPGLARTDAYTLFAQVKNDCVYFIGRIYQKDGLKHIETFKDKSFLKNWGIGGENIGQPMRYGNAEDCILEYSGEKINTIKISYFDPDGTDDDKHAYFEVFLNLRHETVYWRRYSKSSASKTVIAVDGEKYGLGYECITDRFSRIETA